MNCAANDAMERGTSWRTILHIRSARLRSAGSTAAAQSISASIPCDGYKVIERCWDGKSWTTGAFSQSGSSVSATCWQGKGGISIRVYCTYQDKTVEWCWDPGPTWYHGAYTTPISGLAALHRPRAVMLVERDEGEEAFGDLDLLGPRARLATTSMRMPIEVRPIRSTRA